MSAMFGKIGFRTVLYILAIILIIAAVAIFVLSPKEESEKILSPQLVLTNKNLYVNKNIIVEGIYYSSDITVGEPTTDANPIPSYKLNLDLTDITNYTTIVNDGDKYRFSGKLEWVTGSQIPNTDVVLIVEKIEEV